MKIITILGARPQFIKAATVSRMIAQQHHLHEIIIHTGQHFDHNMSQIFFDEMAIPFPRYNLDIHGGTHGAMTGQMLEKIESLLMKEKPNVVLVYGDTNSTLAGALAAVKLHIPVAHVEAGLRSFNRKMPEEINRLVTDHTSTWLFAPTPLAIDNLAQESLADKAHLVGDVMYDAFLFYTVQVAEKATVLNRITLPQKFALATIHRAENSDDITRLSKIVHALNKIHQEVAVVLVLHPRTRAILAHHPKLHLEVNVIEPVGYFDMLQLLQHCCCILTDSGGLQKEAFFSKKPCLTLRDETEWSELVDQGYNQLVGADPDKIEQAFQNTLQSKPLDFSRPLYGEGRAAQKVIDVLLQ